MSDCAEQVQREITGMMQMATATAEQRAAIERLRKSREGGFLSYGGDEKTVADLYLAEHPADDAEPVTREWLESVLDAAIGQWEEWSGVAFHIRRRLRPIEQESIGRAVDIRGTKEFDRRVKAIRKRVGEQVWSRVMTQMGKPQ